MTLVPMIGDVHCTLISINSVCQNIHTRLGNIVKKLKSTYTGLQLWVLKNVKNVKNVNNAKNENFENNENYEVLLK